MKATELMIGDWVCNKEGKNEQVASIYDGYICTETHSDSHDYHFEPIPLTPEILEKNGFERCVSAVSRIDMALVPIQNSNQFCHPKLGNTRVIDERPVHGWTLRTSVIGDTGKNEIHHINSVSQLQHALKLCGIDKEIIL